LLLSYYVLFLRRCLATVMFYFNFFTKNSLLLSYYVFFRWWFEIPYGICAPLNAGTSFTPSEGAETEDGMDRCLKWEHEPGLAGLIKLDSLLTSLHLAQHVLIFRDAAQLPLFLAYDGPYLVLEPPLPIFKVRVGNRQEVLKKMRLKPCRNWLWHRPTAERSCAPN